jgi:hypothetical protein
MKRNIYIKLISSWQAETSFLRYLSAFPQCIIHLSLSIQQWDYTTSVFNMNKYLPELISICMKNVRLMLCQLYNSSLPSGCQNTPVECRRMPCLMFEKQWFKFTAGPPTPCFILVFKAPPSTCLESMTLSHRHRVFCQASCCASYVKDSTSNTVCTTFIIINE